MQQIIFGHVCVAFKIPLNLSTALSKTYRIQIILLPGNAAALPTDYATRCLIIIVLLLF
jgi:hypothetical protein